MTGEKREEVIRRLTDKDDKAAYAFMKEIAAASAVSDGYLGMIPSLAGLLGDRSSYVRTRAFVLICSQARWADKGQIGEVFGQMTPLLRDDRPTAVRQCLNALREVVRFRPELTERIRTAVESVDPGAYRDSVAPLIEKDRDAVLGMTGRTRRGGEATEPYACGREEKARGARPRPRKTGPDPLPEGNA